MGEACGFGMVPIDLDHADLAMGDALAIALMKYRDFRPENFREFHPGGKLGARLSKVRDLMHTGDALPLVPPKPPMADALIEDQPKRLWRCRRHKCGLASLAGIITDGDLRRHMDGLLDQKRS